MPIASARFFFSIFVFLVGVTAAQAQSPFQSAPGPVPAPVVRPPRPSAPQPRDEEMLTVPAPPAPAPPVAAPPPPPPPSLAGSWSQSSNCPLDLIAHPWTLTPTAQEQYRITQGDSSAASGWVSGKQVHLENQVLFSHIVLVGNVDGPTTMSGSVTVSPPGMTCTWFARKN